ncbi:haloacid dehalogenase family hydrolase [Lactobacillus selangorensis]|uniref:Haloacid dehalogenase family hydrolase n=1 Tax=Lactobacillus selangorensis TaxID=81857 RepID=A0A0R2FU72_9LACO|nr:HAD family hydrolase [Lactobacillus selangorensis]KRN28762.1 haloacid dehalogenase family hydrolase [Lactobacillus selangorensis]KRN32828.1 haloacid dehalogenase family hydrolase [Lactobacillus selangorensis]
MKLTFDCYDTLLDMTPIDAVLTEIARTGNVNADKALAIYANYEDRLMYVNNIRPYEKLIAANLDFVDMELSCAPLFKTHYDDVLAAYHQLQPYPEVVPALQALKQQGHQLYLMSNSAPDLMQDHLAVLGNTIEHAFTPDEVGCYKPQKGFFETVGAALHLTNENHLHIAHGYWWDIIPCDQVGWRNIWINRNHLSALPQFQPTYELPDLTELPRLVQQL